MSIHGQLMRLSSIFWWGKQTFMESLKSLDIYLTCDVIGDLEAKFCIAVGEFMYDSLISRLNFENLFISRLNFENPSVTFRFRGRAKRPPPPHDGWQGPGTLLQGAVIISVSAQWNAPFREYLPNSPMDKDDILAQSVSDPSPRKNNTIQTTIH